jgi:hypothetical protein
MWRASSDASRIRRYGIWLVLGGAVAIAQPAATRGGPSIRATQPAAASAPVRAFVRFQALLTTPGGATGVQRVEFGSVLATGGDVATYLSAGSTDNADLCNGSRFAESVPIAQPYYLWRLDSRVVRVSLERSTVDINWTRWKGGVEDASGTRTVTLEPGDYHVLDFVSASAESPRRCVSLMLQMSIEPVAQDDPQPMLAYDVWLLHEGRSGPRWSHQRQTARSTTDAAFDLPLLSWTAGGGPAREEEARVGIRLGVRGSIRATLAPDGFVSVSVAATRTLRWQDVGRGDGGRQDYRARLDEPVAIQLPDPIATAFVTGAQRSATLARGIEFKNGQGTIDFGEFFAGTRTSLVVVVSRVPEGGR